MTDLAPEAGAEDPRPEAEDEDAALLGGEPEAGGQEGEGAEAEAAPAPDDDTEEVEHEGAKYRVPKALKPALMMQADYTQKTQELAEQRKALEAERATHVGASADTIRVVAKITALDEQLGEYAKVDWAALEAQDPDLANKHRWNQADLREKRSAAFTELQTKEQERASIRQREDAKALEQAQTVLSRDIKGWGPELQAKLGKFARDEFGFTSQELNAVRDPRVIKLLNAAFTGAKAQKTQAAAEIAARAEKVQPTPKLGGGGTPKTGLSGLSDGEFMARAAKVIAGKT